MSSTVDQQDPPQPPVNKLEKDKDKDKEKSEKDESSKYRIEGNNLLASNNWQGALEAYTKAIEKDSNNHILYSNRSVPYTKLNQLENAQKDAEKCIELAPNWPKGYMRLAHVLLVSKKLDKALEVVRKGLELDVAQENKFKSSLETILTDIRAAKNAEYFKVLRGKWHGTMPEELGGYDQELDFVNAHVATVNILDREVQASVLLDTTVDPVELDLSVTPPPSENYPSNQSPETVKYIIKIVDERGNNADANNATELWLCSPNQETPAMRPKKFEGVTFVRMKKGPLPSLDPAISQEVNSMRIDLKVKKYIEEAILIFPEGQRLMPLDSDSPETHQRISLMNVKFQSDNFKITKKYGVKTEDIVRNLLLGSTNPVDVPEECLRSEEIKKVLPRLKKKMQNAMLLPSDEEMDQFAARQNDFQGELLPKDSLPNESVYDKNRKVKKTKKKEKKVKISKDKEDTEKHADVLLYVGVALAVVAVGLGIFYALKRKDV